MEEKEMLETTNDTENVETETTEEITDEGIELTDTAEVGDAQGEEQPAKEKKEVKPSLRELLEENPEYQDELNETIIKPRLARKDREYQKELSKYKDTDNVLRTTLKVKDGEDVNQKLREAYEEQGIELPNRYEPGLSEREIERLGLIDAEDIIAEGSVAMEMEAERLANIGYANLNPREKATFTKLASELTDRKEKAELKKLGVKDELLKDEKFIDFRKQFNPNVPIKDVYEMYTKLQPKQKFENPGSMKNITESGKIKSFYTPEEASKFTRRDYDESPELLAAVERSMQQWVK